ncbi:hypothetical protein VZT92_017013 [Zoarces viviparus]|uniref:Uncharacterized protein n=1 Tax=Zoarces viviparus TaxID=48416 RepID=A0AAW1EQP7_ZOAVI
MPCFPHMCCVSTSHPLQNALPPPVSSSKQVSSGVSITVQEMKQGKPGRRCSQDLSETKATKPDLWRNIKRREDRQHRQLIAMKNRL